MQINAHEASRLKKKDKMSIVFQSGKEHVNAIMSVITRSEYDKYPQHYLNYEKTIEIWQGLTKVLIIYGG